MSSGFGVRIRRLEHHLARIERGRPGVLAPNLEPVLRVGSTNPGAHDVSLPTWLDRYLSTLHR